jgi:uncharacterized protein
MRFWNRVSQLVVVLLGLWFGFDLLSHFAVESLWFQEVNYLSVFWLRFGTQAAIWTIVTFSSIAFLLINLSLAQRSKSHSSPLTPHSSPLPNALPWLLPLTFGMSFLIGLLLLHYGKALTSWQIDWTMPTIIPALPTRFRLEAIVHTLTQLISSIRDGWSASVELLLLLIGAIALLIYPRFLLKAGAIILSLSLGFALSHYWGNFLRLFHATTFNRTDPLFNQDISFYIFILPVIELFEFWVIGLFTYGFISVCLTYLLADHSLSEGRVSKFSDQQQRHLAGLGGGLMIAIALTHWVSRYELLYSTRGVAYGASYTDAMVQLPANTALSIGALVISLYLFSQTFSHSKLKAQNSKLFSGYLLAVGVVGFLLPIAVQKLAVQPNELARERPYIQRSIAQTREAFGLTAIEVQTFNPQNNLTFADLQKNNLTIQNIRLWDTRPLLATNRQLQQIRPYYRFFDADIDRYSLPTGPNASEKQQVLIAARELDYNNVPSEAKTWVNEHLVYTHGYGFTVSPVNKVAAGGLPDYLVRDIETTNRGGNALSLANDRIRDSIPTANPRLYYGEIANTYVMTSTKVREFDYPSGNENAYTVYDGQGGISMRSFWRKLAFSKTLNDWQMLLTRNFTPDTKLLFRRNINQRIRAIAPFLRFDQDPYLVAVDAGNLAQSPTQNYLYWIVDAYTTSDRYPYSDPGKLGFNYIRNSVKVVIDAYNGSVNFYVTDPQDPIIQTWAAIFPNLFKPLNAMPTALQNHLRYPADLFNSQSDRLITYHMTDPQVFYNREDQWQVPNEIYGNKPQPVEPYYLITNLPTTVNREEFVLLMPYTPNQRTNLIAWLAARSDGQNYGKLLLYTFPKQELVFGTEQIEARINQDPVISQQISLWNRAGSRAIQGNLLVIPIEQSLLYVEPLYLEAEQNSLPTLVRVIVAYENRIAMAATLDEALKAVFQSKPPPPAIVRPVE